MDARPAVDQATAHNERQRSYYRGAGGLHRNIAPGESPYVHRHIDEVLKAAGVAPGARVLDVGCGAGRHALLLAARGYEVDGLDLSADLLASIHARQPGAMRTHCADIAQPPKELEGRFEAVLGFFMLHHLLDPQAAFAGVAGVLRPGGRAVFIEPNPFNPLYYVQIAFTPHMRWQAERGILQMRASVLFPAARAAGLVNPSVRRIGFLPPFLRNRVWGGAVDRAAERAGVLEPVLAAQVFRMEKPGV